MEKGQRVVFVRDVNGAGVGKHGTVIKVADDAVLVGCKLNGHLVVTCINKRYYRAEAVV